MMKRILSAALVLIFMAVALVGCGDSKESGQSASGTEKAPDVVVTTTTTTRPSTVSISADVAGLYVTKTVNGQPVDEYFTELGGGDVDLQVLLDAFGISSAEEIMTIELKSDGTFVMSTPNEDSDEGTRSISGDQLALTLNGITDYFPMNGYEFSMEADGDTLVFAKKQ